MEFRIAEGYLALGNVIDNKWNKAEEIYLKQKNKEINEYEKITWNKIFLQDIEDLEAAGITHPDFAKVRALLSQ